MFWGDDRTDSFFFFVCVFPSPRDVKISIKEINLSKACDLLK